MRKTIGLTILLLCIYFAEIQLQIVSAQDKPDLYSPVDDVIRLNSRTFQSTVFGDNKNITYLVQFYNTFCGHCQMFAPIYKELASRVKNWTSVVRVAGIDCSKDENINTCSDNRVEGYPTIYVFPPNARYKDPNDQPLNLRSLNIEWTVDDIEETLVNYIFNLTSSNREYPLVVNAMKPVTVTKLSDFHRLYPSISGDVVDQLDNQDLMFIVEPESSYLGRKLIIEYYRIHSKLELRRIMLSNKKLLENILTKEDQLKVDDSQPLLLRVNDIDDMTKAQVLVRGEAKQILSTRSESERQDYIHNRFKKFFEHFYAVELKESDNMAGISHRTKDIDKSPTNEVDLDVSNKGEIEILYLIHHDPIGSKKVFAIDLLKGITYMLTHEVRIKGDLNPMEFNTIRNFLTILKKYLPLENWDSSVNKFVENLRTELDKNRSVYEINGVKSREMKDLLELAGSDAISTRYGRENWISCYESERQHKGYTCSLWLLFHTLTVGEHSKAAPVLVRPTLVLYTMRDYITRFLGCTVCSVNFAKETEKLETSLVSRNSSVLWLWNTHNLVNQRLNNEKQKDKRSLNEVIFPHPKRCPDCFKSKIEQIGSDGKTLNDVEWNLSKVFDYLTRTYAPEKIASPLEMASLLNNIKTKVSYDVIKAEVNQNRPETIRLVTTSSMDMNRSVEEWNIQGIFSTSDMGICLILYLSCILMVVIVCYSLTPKNWRRFKTK